MRQVTKHKLERAICGQTIIPCPYVSKHHFVLPLRKLLQNHQKQNSLKKDKGTTGEYKHH